MIGRAILRAAGKRPATRLVAALGALALLSACGGGSSGTLASTGASGSGTGATGSTPTPSPTPTPTLANYVSVVVDDGPAALQQGTNGYTQSNVAYATVTICVPGTMTCQTIDHITVDTGSVGLRLVNGALNSNIAAALPMQTDTAGNPVGECYGYVDGYTFGSVRQADFTIGGEQVANMPIHIIGDTGRFATVPSQCSAGGGSSLVTVQDLGSNGIIGIGTTPTDCGADCTFAGGYGAAIYYDCPATGCAGIITRASTTAAPFQQLPNPVAAMGTDNNGTILVLPAVSGNGVATLTGTLYFGIGTQTNNALSATTILPVTTSTSSSGSGLLTAIYNGQTLANSFIDSGSNGYFFVDTSITACTNSNVKGFYCPASPLPLSPMLRGTNGTTASAAFTLMNALTLAQTGYAALPGLGANPNATSNLHAPSSSFDFGLPFFFGRRVYTAIEGRTAGGTAGPYVAF